MNRRPNIVIFVPDEMNTRFMSCYDAKQKITPFIDSIAEKGVKFNNYFTVHAKCSPARVSLMTGTHPHVGGHRTLQLLGRPEEPNMIRTLRENGYTTALFGRNHMCEDQTLEETFDHHDFTAGKWTLDPKDPTSTPVGSYFIGQDDVPLEEYVDRIRTQTAIDWMEKDKPDDKPFYMQVNLNHPHPPYGVPKPYYGKIDRSSIELPDKADLFNSPRFHQILRETYELDGMSDDQWRDLIATHMEMCTFVDDECKRVFQSLEKQGLIEDTLFIIWVDHGDFAGEYQLTEKWDTALYDCITHVPLIMHAPKWLKPTEVDAFIQTVDVLPTALGLAGVEVPKGVQGKSFLPVINGESDGYYDTVLSQGGQERELVMNPVPFDGAPRPCKAYLKKQEALCKEPTINLKAKAIRDHDFKYINHLYGVEELFDLKKDPNELKNISTDPAYAEQLSTYRHKMVSKLMETETILPYQEQLES